MHRVGRAAAMVEWKNRPLGCLVLRHQPVAGRLAAASAFEGNVHLGGGGRLVPRYDPPRRDSLHLLGELVRYASEDRAIRSWRTRAAQRGFRSKGMRRRNPV